MRNAKIMFLIRTDRMMVCEEHIISYRHDAVVALRSIWSVQFNADNPGCQVNFHCDRSSLKILENTFHIHAQFPPPPRFVPLSICSSRMPLTQDRSDSNLSPCFSQGSFTMSEGQGRRMARPLYATAVSVPGAVATGSCTHL